MKYARWALEFGVYVLLLVAVARGEEWLRRWWLRRKGPDIRALCRRMLER